jgi:outer membrane protein assembly factor BamB
LFSVYRAFVLLLILSACLGCGAKKYVSQIVGGIDNTEPPSPLIDFVETAKLDKVWSQDTGKGTDELFIKLVPAVLGDQIFTADTRGNITALFADTGKKIWRIDSDLPITGGPGADESLITVGTSEGEILSLSIETGEEVWRSTVSSEILSSPREADGVVIVRTIDGKIFALDAITGDRLWVYDRTVPALTLRGTSTPVIANNLVIAGFDGGRVTALELKTGKLIWETKVAVSRGRSELERMVDIDSQPLIVGDTIYVTTFQANVAAISLESGQILWQRDISSHSELGAEGGQLYVTDEMGNVWALDRFSGASIWKQEKLTFRQVTGPAILGDMVVVGDLKGYLHWLNKATGDFAARTRIGSDPILTQPIVANDILFAYSSDGTLSAYTYYNKALKDLPKKPIVKEKPISTKEEPGQVSTNETDTKKTAETTNTEAKAEEEGSLFGRFLEIFTGEEEEEEEEEE